MNCQPCRILLLTTACALCLAEPLFGSMAQWHSESNGMAAETLQAKTGPLKPHKKIKAQIKVFAKVDGARKTPFFRGYRPACLFGEIEVTGTVTKLPDGVDMVKPGDEVIIEFELYEPVELEKSTRFQMREGGRPVGECVVTEVLD